MYLIHNSYAQLNSLQHKLYKNVLKNRFKIEPNSQLDLNQTIPNRSDRGSSPIHNM